MDILSLNKTMTCPKSADLQGDTRALSGGGGGGGANGSTPQKGGSGYQGVIWIRIPA